MELSRELPWAVPVPTLKAIVDNDAVFNFAKLRQQLHKDQDTSRPLSEDYEFVGLAGEIAFSELFDMPIDLRSLAGGDKGVDFTTRLGTVDVKTARKAFNLIVEKGKVVADIYVLASYDGKTKAAELLGWEYGSVIKTWPIKDFGYGIFNHFMTASVLKPMSDLICLLMI